MTEESKLAKLKKNYSEIGKKHKLPSFEEMNKEFQIEKVAEDETDFLLRDIRKAVGDKLANYMKFAEAVLIWRLKKSGKSRQKPG